MEDLVNALVGFTGLQGAALMGVFALLSVVCRLVGKMIPDTATGVLGVVRRVCKVIGLYVSNRLDSTTTTDDTVAKVAGIKKH